MTSSGNGPKPWKDYDDFKRARRDFKKFALWRPSRIRPSKGGTYTKKLLDTYHNNFQMGSRMLRMYAKTPLFLTGTAVVLSLTASYKYYQSVNDNARIEELSIEVARLNGELEAERREKIAQNKIMQDMANDWWNLRNWGWFKKK